MPVSVNQINNDAAGRNIELLQTAIGLARDVYKIKMDDNQIKRAEAFKQQELSQKAAADSQNQEVSINKEFAPVPEGTKGGFKLPGKEGIFLPRSDITADLNRKNALQVAGAANTAKASEADFSRTQKLSDDYSRDSKPTVLAVEGYKKLEAAASNPNPTGATDIALLYGYMKSIDPGSTVREGEFANADNAQGVPSRIQNMYNKVMSGERLTPEQRVNFVSEGKRSLQAQLDIQKGVDNRYKTKAENFKVNPEYVVNSDFERLRKEYGEMLKSNGIDGPSFEQKAYAGSEGKDFKYQPGTILNVGGKRMRVNADGQTATEIK